MYVGIYTAHTASVSGERRHFIGAFTISLNPLNTALPSEGALPLANCTTLRSKTVTPMARGVAATEALKIPLESLEAKLCFSYSSFVRLLVVALILSVCLSICLSVYLSVYLSKCIYISISRNIYRF